MSVISPRPANSITLCCSEMQPALYYTGLTSRIIPGEVYMRLLRGTVGQSICVMLELGSNPDSNAPSLSATNYCLQVFFFIGKWCYICILMDPCND